MIDNNNENSDSWLWKKLEKFDKFWKRPGVEPAFKVTHFVVWMIIALLAL